MKYEPLSPRTQKLVNEHLPLLEPFGVGRLDIANIVTECKYDAQAIALRVQTLVNSKCDGRATTDLLWQCPKERVPKKPAARPKGRNAVKKPTKVEQTPTKVEQTPAEIQHITSPISKTKTTPAKSTPVAPKTAETKTAESKTVESKAADTSRVRPGQTWAQRVKGDQQPQQPQEEEEKVVAPVETAVVEEPKKSRPAPPQVFSWVAAAQGKRLVKETEVPAPAVPVEEEEEEEAPQPVPERVCDIHRTSTEEVTPPAGFETEPRARYHPSSPPIIKQREQPPPPPPPMYEQRVAANNYIQRTAYNAYQQQMKYAAYGGMDYFAPEDNKVERQMPPPPPMFHHHMPHPAESYPYDPRDYFMRAREPDRSMMYGYSRPVMPPMFATAVGRTDMVHEQPEYGMYYAPRAPEFYPASQWR